MRFDSARHVLLSIVCLVFLAASGQGAEAPVPPAEDLSELSIEELLDLEVFSVSRKDQPQFRVASAVHVLTGEDLRRSGVMSIPEALRLVPGMSVARLNANRWAITCRGFSEYYANKLLVMIDGRTVYSPIFSGVMWEENDVMLEDLDRIEVIRGPGATSWGANAVNGVVNILSKSARDTQGWLLSTGCGTELQNQTALRYGGAAGENTWYRIWGKFTSHDALMYNEDIDGDDDDRDAHDGWTAGQFGFRVDHEAGRDRLTVQGDVHTTRIDHELLRYNPATGRNELERGDEDSKGMNLLARWQRAWSKDSELSVQFFYDRLDKVLNFTPTRVDTYDLDLQHRLRLGARHDVVWGLGYRTVRDAMDSTPEFSFDPESRQESLFSAFIQDEIALVPERLSLTVGSKFDHNYHTGFEFQPSARLLYTPREDLTFWGAVSRAVRTPSRFEDDVTFNRFALAGPASPFVPRIDFTVHPEDDNRSESLHAYELGVRVSPVPSLLLELNTFYQVYNRLVWPTAPTQRFTVDGTTPVLLQEQTLDDDARGHTYGAEVTAHWKVNERFTLKGGYSHLHLKLYDHGAQDERTHYRYAYGTGPENIAYVTGSFDLPHRLELDLTGHYMDHNRFWVGEMHNVPSFVDLDMRLGWRPNQHTELALIGRNLLDSHRPEFESQTANEPSPTENERGLFLKLTLRF